MNLSAQPPVTTAVAQGRLCAIHAPWTGGAVRVSRMGAGKRVVRQSVIRFQEYNRRKKVRAITGFMRQHGCSSILLTGVDDTIGSYGGEHLTGFVERRLAETDGFYVKMGINIEPKQTDYPFRVADARDMPFEDDYVDIAVANAIIEHVGDKADQQRFVNEQARVGRCFVITTPNRWFPVEAHTSTIFRHWSSAWRAQQRSFTRLLSKREFAELLPEGAVLKGTFLSPTFSAYYDKTTVRGSAAAPRVAQVVAD